MDKTNAHSKPIRVTRAKALQFAIQALKEKRRTNFSAGYSAIENQGEIWRSEFGSQHTHYLEYTRAIEIFEYELEQIKKEYRCQS